MSYKQNVIINCLFCTMFTGIIESFSTVVDIRQDGTNVVFHLQSNICNEFKIDQSIAHNGICLTVTEINEDKYSVTAIKETLSRTNLGQLNIGDKVNIERCLKAGDRFDGHYVQGHVDCVGHVDEIHDLDGSHMIFISHPFDAGITVGKGSITINGISLTVIDSFPDAFSVAIIPYTWEHTNLHSLKEGDSVNIEFDVLGKYLQKIKLMGG